MRAAGCTGPVLDEEDIAYTREVLAPFLEAEDMRTCIECLFGDAAGRTLGFTPRGLSHWAGLAAGTARCAAGPNSAANRGGRAVDVNGLRGQHHPKSVSGQNEYKMESEFVGSMSGGNVHER